MTTYPTQPTGDNSVDLTNIFASNSTSKIIMSSSEILAGYNNDGEPSTPLTSTPDGNKFNYFWYQVHNTLVWVVNYTKALFDNKLELSGGTMTGNLSLGSNKATSSYVPLANSDLTNKLYVDTAVSGAMWLGEPKFLTYPTIPTLPSGMEVVNADGRAISRTTYSAYFALVGTTYGVGDGSTTFNIPDLRGKNIVGWNGSGALDVGRTFGSDQKREASRFTTKPNINAPSVKSYNTSYQASEDGYISIMTSRNGALSLSEDGIDWVVVYRNSHSDQDFGDSAFIKINKGMYYKGISYKTSASTQIKFYPEIQSVDNSSYTQTNIALYPVVRIK